MNVHRAALAALLAVSSLLPSASYAACSTPTPVCADKFLALGEVIGGGTGGGGDGVVCTYVKLFEPAPSDWGNEDYQDPPYVFERTQSWGNKYEHRQGYDWDYRFCVLPCPVLEDPPTMAVLSCVAPGR